MKNDGINIKRVRKVQLVDVGMSHVSFIGAVCGCGCGCVCVYVCVCVCVGVGVGVGMCVCVCLCVRTNNIMRACVRTPPQQHRSVGAVSAAATYGAHLSTVRCQKSTAFTNATSNVRSGTRHATFFTMIQQLRLAGMSRLSLSSHSLS